jgi:acetylornithine deacetylase/succinyl-diaminopimelate desuccinylase-like protein
MEGEIMVYLSKNRESHLNELFQFLSKESISSLPDYKEKVQETAEWTAQALKNAGMENVKVYETEGHPVVYGDYLHKEGKPTVLVYGHYDVQPVDPLHLWKSPPFSPEIRDDKIFARGASDDKGQVFMHIKAVEAILKTI